jgi:hypothetical protein
VKSILCKIFAFFLFCTLAVTVSTYAGEPLPHANCCLCMCHAKDETRCSRMCIRLQHSKRIIEEPEMNKCTAECKRVHVQVTK